MNNYITNNNSAVIIGKKTTWIDCEGLHVGIVSEIWEDQNIAVCDGEEGIFGFTMFVPISITTS